MDVLAERDIPALRPATVGHPDLGRVGRLGPHEDEAGQRPVRGLEVGHQAFEGLGGGGRRDGAERADLVGEPPRPLRRIGPAERDDAAVLAGQAEPGCDGELADREGPQCSAWIHAGRVRASTPSSSIAAAPVSDSSAGWKTNITVPASRWRSRAEGGATEHGAAADEVIV